MLWYQIKIENCPAADIERLSETLDELDCLSITLSDKNDNPVLEPAPGTTPLWPEVVVHALYAQQENMQHCLEQLKQNWPHLHCSLEVIPDKEWERVWMDDFKPQRFGQRLWICPSWSTPPEPDAICLMLDPGLAFGTGSHPTTSLCLTWLEQASLENKSLIDYGCGSGILSLAALKLGAAHVFAVDIDPQALQATQENAKTNHIQEKRLSVGLPDALNQNADLIIANILLAPLCDLKERFHALLPQNGLLVVSGILSEQESTLIDTYQSAFQHEQTSHQDGWALLVFKKKGL